MSQISSLGAQRTGRRNLLKGARAVVERHDGLFPADLDTLLKLPGVGPYTAAALASIAFDRPETVVDGNVERVIARLFAVETPLPSARPELRALAARLTPQQRPGDYAQAIMDLGATVCTPTKPKCFLCPWREDCAAYAAGDMEAFPKKSPKAARPQRFGFCFARASCSAISSTAIEPEPSSSAPLKMLSGRAGRTRRSESVFTTIARRAAAGSGGSPA